MIKNFFISTQRLKALSLVLLLGLSLVFSLLSSPLANAASDYNMKTTNSLKLKGNSPSGDCGTEEEWNVRWPEFMSTDTANPNSYKNTWNYTNNYDNARATMDAFHDNYVSNLGSGAGWAVQQRSSSGAGIKAITIYLFDPGANLTVQDQRLLPSSGVVRFETFGYNPNAGCRWQAFDYNSNDNYPVINNINSDNPLLLVASDHIIYPSDYSGFPLPSSFTPKPDFYVPYILNVDDKNVTVSPKTIDTGGKCWKWASTLVKKGASTSDNLGDWEVISETDYLASNEPAHLRAKDYGTDYAIGMLAYDCDAPAAKISDLYNLKLERVFPLKIDGSSYVLDSANLNCDNGGVCEEPSPYEDCSTYGTDLIGGLGCIFRNFGVFLRSLFITLFVPSSGFIKDYFTQFKDFITTKLGFLVWPLQWAVGFINAFFDGLDGTNNICSWSFGNLFNSDLKLNFCSLEQNFPTPFNTVRYMIQAFTVFGLISGLYAHYRRLIHT
jgi:hypothetical protein